ncbi:GroES-like protein [Mytilinidion resinicola]|uniref:GroES-like protein n=1 Tax=Mytilinidion resinicola TaxID=574789 RepID=A0A6A6YXY6_9PEZI|nr:GroES-like protein [Mytilinidion resinicola]KAF2813293.1 GroES-like protein [Mytilinidion resinicola]
MPSDITVFKGSASGQLVQSITPGAPLQEGQVLIKIHHASLCGTDLHYLHSDQVIGHEGAGIVEELGPDVKHLKVGARVGFGWHHDSCGACPECLRGDGPHCRVDPHAFGDHELDQGGFATHAVWKADFLHPIPDALSTADAAPLMCAGITVYTPLIRNVKPGQRVGVVGIGALGHLAIQFAAAMGADVVAFSGTEEKKSEAIKFGAKEFVATKGKTDLAAELKGGLLDHLVVTTSAVPDWKQYIGLMAPYGSVYPLTISFGNLEIPIIPFVVKSLNFVGSTVGSRVEFRQMLDFAVLHGIRPVIEKFPLTLEGLAEAKAKMEKGELRYKAVMET